MVRLPSSISLFLSVFLWVNLSRSSTWYVHMKINRDTVQRESSAWWVLKILYGSYCCRNLLIIGQVEFQKEKFLSQLCGSLLFYTTYLGNLYLIIMVVICPRVLCGRFPAVRGNTWLPVIFCTKPSERQCWKGSPDHLWSPSGQRWWVPHKHLTVAGQLSS